MDKYIDLDVWIKSRELVKLIYDITKHYPDNEKFGIINQMRRCAVSIPSNIAEGCGRNHDKDSMQFFFIARGSLYELETQIYLSFDLNYINKTECDSCLNLVSKCRKILAGFINYFKEKSENA